MSAEKNSHLVSKRALQRLAEAQRSLASEMRLLSEMHTRFLGALMACDSTTQQNTLMEYREQLYSVHSVLAKLRIMLEKHGEDVESGTE